MSAIRQLKVVLIVVVVAATALTVRAGQGQRRRPEIMPEPPIVGRWDVTVHHPDGAYPSWFEVKQSGFRALVGQFVGQSGSARPVSRFNFAAGKLSFSLQPQWEMKSDFEWRERDLQFDGELKGERLEGTTVANDGKIVKWSAARAPSLKRAQEPAWGEPIELFNGKDLSGWQMRPPNTRGWAAREGLLVNARPGTNLLTTQKFADFKLHAEFRYPRGSNSGIYLRGRYEVQIEDNFGQEPDSHRIGGVYGFLKPRINAVKPAGEWQTFDIVLVGRTVTVALNGETIIDRQEVPGITGGALDSNEGEPGPIYLQGDHGPIEFRKLTLTPGK